MCTMCTIRYRVFFLNFYFIETVCLQYELVCKKKKRERETGFLYFDLSFKTVILDISKW